MQTNQSSYPFWSWVIAIALALLLLWMYTTGNGPNTCCTEKSAPTAQAEGMETPPAITEAFSFSATEYEFSSTGDASHVNWAGESLDALNALLSGGITAEGDERMIVLTGSADSEGTKQQKGLDAQAYFGPDATIENQITIMEPIAAEEPIVVMDLPPSAAKLYFDSGVHRLPSDSAATLDPVITWLNSNANAKAIISGYHDTTGDLASNARLAKKRAESAYNALITAGIEEDRIEMRKPESAEGGGDLSEARRVEVSIE